MNKEIVKDALEIAYQLLDSEVQTIELEDLQNDYMIVIAKIEKALKELEK